MKIYTICKPLLIVLVLFSVLTGCKTKSKQAAGIPALKVMEIKPARIPAFLQTVGQATGIPTVEIRARVGGYLQSWSFKEGSIVQKGQLLFTIEQAQYVNNVNYAQADLDIKQAAWEKAQLDVARLKPLLATNAISQNDYDKAVTTERQDKAAVASAKANLDQARLDLSYTTMYSPITGQIGACNVQPGNLVGKGESTLLTTVSAVDPIYVNFQINETDYLKIMRFAEQYREQLKTMAADRDMLKIYAVTSDKVQYDYPGTLDFVDRGINPQTGTIAMRAVFQNPHGLIKPGTFTTLYIVLLEQEGGIAIPQSATMQIQGKDFVFLVGKDNKVNRIPVLLGRSMGNTFIVNKGLKAGDRILLEGFQKFQEGMEIKPVMVKDTLTIPSSPVNF